MKQSVTPSPDNPARPLQKSNPNGLQDELIRHLKEDSTMSGFDFGLQFLDADRMTYWGKRRDANFWIENASVEWNEAEAPFHTVARLTLLPASQLSVGAGEAIYFDVTGHATPDSRPLGALIAPAGMGRLPAEKPACARTAVVNHNHQCAVAALIEPSCKRRQTAMKTHKRIRFCAAVAAFILTATFSAIAQQITGTPGSPSATVTIDGKQIPPPPMQFGGVIKDKRQRFQAVLAASLWCRPRARPTCCSS